MRTTIVEAVADLYDVVKDLTIDGVTVQDVPPNPNQRPAGPSLYVSPVAQPTPDHQNWNLTLEFSVSADAPGTTDSQRIMWRTIDAVEDAFDNHDPGFETTWQSGIRLDLGILVCSWTVTMPKEEL